MDYDCDPMCGACIDCGQKLAPLGGEHVYIPSKEQKDVYDIVCNECNDSGRPRYHEYGDECNKRWEEEQRRKEEFEDFIRLRKGFTALGDMLEIYEKQ